MFMLKFLDIYNTKEYKFPPLGNSHSNILNNSKSQYRTILKHIENHSKLNHYQSYEIEQIQHYNLYTIDWYYTKRNQKPIYLVEYNLNNNSHFKCCNSKSINCSFIGYHLVFKIQHIIHSYQFNKTHMFFQLNEQNQETCNQCICSINLNQN